MVERLAAPPLLPSFRRWVRWLRRGGAVVGVGSVIAAGAYTGSAYLAQSWPFGATHGAGGGGSSFPNTSGANVFVSPTGSDSGANCVRFSPATNSVPTASTVCATVAKAYDLAAAGDTVWVLPGTYSGELGFGYGTSFTSKTVSDPTDCNATDQCVYVIPQPGQENSVVAGGLDFARGGTPDHLYYQGFIRDACMTLKNVSSDGKDLYDNSTTGFAQDITFKNGEALQANGDDCQGAVLGPWSYIRWIGGEYDRACTRGEASGWSIRADSQGNGGYGESYSHLYAPSHLLFNGVIFDQYQVSCSQSTPADHEDCLHVFAWTYSTIENSVFVNCYDASVLGEGLDEAGYDEHVLIQNNWFGPTQLAVNNCCIRGDNTPSNETYDGWTIRFNSSATSWQDKPAAVLNNVSFVGNVGLGDQSCINDGDNGSTNVVYAYNIYGGSTCGGTGDLGNQSNTNVKFVNPTATTPAALDMHLQAGSVAAGFVPGSQSPGCAAVGTDKDGNARPSPCAAGAEEP